jgi:hypothetical protein
MDIRQLGPRDDDRVYAAAHLFDGPADAVATRTFLNADGHHLLVAYDGDTPVGFVTGVETTHPDKGTEMFLTYAAAGGAAERQQVVFTWTYGAEDST